MNTVNLVGRLTRDPDIRYANSGTSIARFSVAVDRRIKSENGPTADFIPCTAFGKTAEFLEKYFHKGQRIGIVGRIQTGSYTNNDGQKVYTMDVIVETVEFVESRSTAGGFSDGGAPEKPASGGFQTGPADAHGFVDVPDGLDDELPFN